MFLIFRSLDFFPIFRLNSCGWHAFFKMEYWMQLGLALHWLHLQQYTTMINLVIRALFFFLFCQQHWGKINLENTMALCRQSCFSSYNRRRSKSSRVPDNADCLHDCLATPLPTLWILGLWKDCNWTTSKHPPALYLNLPAKSANERNVFVFSPPRGNHWRALRWQQEVDHPHSYKTAGPPPRSSFYLFLPRNSRSPASQPTLLGKTLYTLSSCKPLPRLAKL